MRSVDDKGPAPRPPARFNLAEYVFSGGRATPDKIALSIVSPSGATRWSYARLEAAALGTAAGFLNAGAEPGDRILLGLGNSVEFPLAFLGALAVDLIPLPVSATLTPRELAAVIEAVRPHFMVSETSTALPQSGVRWVFSPSDLRAFQKLPPARYTMGDPNRPGYILFTSGTGSAPRPVLHAHRAIWARMMMFEGWHGLTREDRILHAGAFNWSYTLGTGLLDPWSIGATSLIVSQTGASEAIPLLLRRLGVSVFAAVPGVYRQILKKDLPHMPALRHGLSAGEKLPDALRTRWTETTSTPLFEAFGMTECSTFLSGSPRAPAPPGTLGYTQTGRSLAILGEDDAPVPRGTPGRIAISTRDPGLMLGYLENDQLRPPEGDWFASGDLGEMQADGAITHLGRMDDVITAGGYRISPIEIEAVMTAQADVQDAAAVSHRVAEDTTVVALHYVGSAEEDSLRRHAAENLAPYKRPRIYIKSDALPRSANGKLLRRVLRAH